MKLFNLFEEQTAERKETRKFAFILQDALIELGATDTKIKFGSDKNIVEGTITLIYEINSYKLSLQYYCSYLLLEDNFLFDSNHVLISTDNNDHSILDNDDLGILKIQLNWGHEQIAEYIKESLKEGIHNIYNILLNGPFDTYTNQGVDYDSVDMKKFLKKIIKDWTKQKHNFNDVIIKDNVKQINNNSNDNKNIKLLIPLVELAFKDYMLYTHAREYED